MKEMNEHFEQVRQNGDEMAWMMMVSILNRHYTESYEANAGQVKQLRRKMAPGTAMADRLNELGEELLEKQSEALPRLADIAENHLGLADLYMRYDELKLKRFHLEQSLRVQREELKNALRASLRDL